MKKKILLLMGVFSIGFILHAQIGINTETPLALFHADPLRNTTSTTVGVDDDFVVTNNGDVGIGTVSPTNKLSIVPNGSQTDTGLHLPNNAIAGYSIESDATGNAVWEKRRGQYYTMVEGTGDGTTSLFTGAYESSNAIQLKFFSVVFDKVKSIFGSNYGWDNTKQHYVVPVTGIYRIAYSVYFHPETRNKSGYNPRAYLFKNNAELYSPGIISIIDTGNEVIGFTMGLAFLNKGDIIDIRVCVYKSPSGVVKIFSGKGHTSLIIESL